MYIWYDMMGTSIPQEVLTTWTLQDQPPFVEQPISEYWTSDLRAFSVQQGRRPSLRFLCLDSEQKDMVYFVEQRCDRLIGENASRKSPSFFQERVVGVPVRSGIQHTVEGWYDASKPYDPTEPRIRCMGSRISIQASNVTEQYMIDRDSQISISVRDDCSLSRWQERVIKLDVRGESVEVQPPHSDSIGATDKFEGDGDWLVGSSMEHWGIWDNNEWRTTGGRMTLTAIGFGKD